MTPDTERIRLVESDPRWPARFSDEAGALRRALSDRGLVAIEHIGSTAIPGLRAKPIIDIMAGADRIDRVVPEWRSTLESLGYRYRNDVEHLIPERRYFDKGKGTPNAFHLHIVERDTSFWREHLDFRDWLRTHPTDAKAYARLKQELADQFGYDRRGYCDAKSEFIECIVETARIHAASPPPKSSNESPKSPQSSSSPRPR
ncbi:MAG: GrpB family protein [Phycisphaerales bacterium]